MQDPKITLASGSPRRLELLSNAGFQVEVSPTHVEENADIGLKPEAYAMELAEIKNEAHPLAGEAECLVSADTIVVANNKILNKPKDAEEAKEMISQLSGNTHEVITAVCIRFPYKKEIFYDSTIVHFKEIPQSAIDYYVETYSPMDKAGAYGIQEWLGYRFIEKIDGCYYNVMGFPIAMFCERLRNNK